MRKAWKSLKKDWNTCRSLYKVWKITRNHWKADGNQWNSSEIYGNLRNQWWKHRNSLKHQRHSYDNLWNPSNKMKILEESRKILYKSIETIAKQLKWMENHSEPHTRGQCVGISAGGPTCGQPHLPQNHTREDSAEAYLQATPRVGNRIYLWKIIENH